MREINSQKKSATMTKIIRLLGSNRAYDKSSIAHDEQRQMTHYDYSERLNLYSLKTTNLALQEAERKKAEAFMQRQKHSFIC